MWEKEVHRTEMETDARALHFTGDMSQRRGNQSFQATNVPELHSTTATIGNIFITFLTLLCLAVHQSAAAMLKIKKMMFRCEQNHTSETASDKPFHISVCIQQETNSEPLGGSNCMK